MADKPVNHGRDHRRGGTDPTPSGTAYALLWFNVNGDSGHNQTVGGSISPPEEADIQWYGFRTNDTSVFGTGDLPTVAHNLAGDKWLQMYLAGSYDFLSAVLWEDGTFNRYAYLTSFAGFTVPEYVHSLEVLAANDEGTTTTSLKSGYKLVQEASMKVVLSSDDGPGAVKYVAGNADTASHQIVSGVLACYYQGDNTLGTEADDTVYP